MKLNFVQVRMIDIEQSIRCFTLSEWELKSHSHISDACIGTLTVSDQRIVESKLRELKGMTKGRYVQLGYCYSGFMPKAELTQLYGFNVNPVGFLFKEVTGCRVSAIPCDAGGYWTLNIMNKDRNKGLEDYALNPLVFLQPELTFTTNEVIAG